MTSNLSSNALQIIRNISTRSKWNLFFVFLDLMPRYYHFTQCLLKFRSLHQNLGIRRQYAILPVSHLALCPVRRLVPRPVPRPVIVPVPRPAPRQVPHPALRPVPVLVPAPVPVPVPLPVPVPVPVPVRPAPCQVSPVPRQAPHFENRARVVNWFLIPFSKVGDHDGKSRETEVLTGTQ
jgi:hypothetical protein